MRVIGALCLGAALLGLFGCESVGEGKRETAARRLRSSGFVFVPTSDFASDPRFNNLAPYKLQAVTVKSGTVYVYPALANGGAFIGGPRQMEAYQRKVLNNRTRQVADQTQTTLARDRRGPPY